MRHPRLVRTRHQLKGLNIVNQCCSMLEMCIQLCSSVFEFQRPKARQPFKSCRCPHPAIHPSDPIQIRDRDRSVPNFFRKCSPTKKKSAKVSPLSWLNTWIGKMPRATRFRKAFVALTFLQFCSHHFWMGSINN